MNEPPIKGMTAIPVGGDDLPLMGAFVSCVYWAIGEDDARRQFRADTGIDLSAIVPNEQAGQQELDSEAEIIAKFADWVAVNIWGVAE